MADPLRLRTATDKPCRPLDGDFLTTVLVEVAPARRLRRLPLNLGLLIDTSESMQGDKLDQAREAVIGMLARLQPDDLVTLVSFASRPETHLRAQQAGPETHERARGALMGLRAEGVTQLLRGLETANAELRRNAGPDRSSFLVLLSDGFPTTNQGYIDAVQEPYLVRVDREMRDRGISLSTIGLGDAANYDQAFLRRLSDKGNGQFYYCQSPTALAQDFSREIGRIQRTVLGDVQLSVRHLDGTLRRLWRVFPDKKLFDTPQVVDGAFSVPIGSLQDEQPQAFLLDIVTSARPTCRERLLEVDAEWFGEGRTNRATAPVVLEWTDDARALAQRNQEVVRLAAECLDALLEEELEDAVSTGSVAKQTSVLARKKQLTARLGKVEATQVLEEMEDALAAGQPISQDALARSSQHTKPTQRLG
ncbi:MAG: VWA domain-containing protein [Armatimonadetes bacterium]|nr:VWA domain-containing protein [Armatimonadota bacterium]